MSTFTPSLRFGFAAAPLLLRSKSFCTFAAAWERLMRSGVGPGIIELSKCDLLCQKVLCFGATLAVS